MFFLEKPFLPEQWLVLMIGALIVAHLATASLLSSQGFSLLASLLWPLLVVPLLLLSPCCDEWVFLLSPVFLPQHAQDKLGELDLFEAPEPAWAAWAALLAVAGYTFAALLLLQAGF